MSEILFMLILAVNRKAVEYNKTPGLGLVVFTSSKRNLDILSNEPSGARVLNYGRNNALISA